MQVLVATYEILESARMEGKHPKKREPSVPFRRRRLGVPRSMMAVVPLLAFLILYNCVPAVHQSVQSFFSLSGWNIETDPVVHAASAGTFAGKVLRSTNHPIPIEAFLGIPYAVPPINELRFARPVPVPESNKTFQAKEYSSRSAHRL